MILTDVEVIDDPPRVIYWLGTEKVDRIVGVCFEGTFTNIARQSQAESIAMMLDLDWDNVFK